MKEYIGTTRDKLEIIKYETEGIAQSLKKISDAVAGIDNRKNTVFGATLENIIDLISEYEIRDGRFPASSESIKKAFEPDRIKTNDKEVFTAKVQVELYNLLPLHNVLTDYEGMILHQGAIVKIIEPLFIADRRAFDLLIDRRLVVPDLQMMTAKEAALTISHEIMKSNLYKWKAFAAQIFQYSEDRLDVVYGIAKDKT